MIMDMKHKVFGTGRSKVVVDLNPLIEQIWHEMDGQVSHTRIRQVILGVAAGFRDAPVATNIPLFIRHLAREWLRDELGKQDLNA
jgi:hypothetical protein